MEMASKIWRIVILFSFLSFFAQFTNCHTHWAVNENGRIEENVDTLFNMADPQDLHQFFKQQDLISKFDEERRNIFEQKEIITFHESKDDPLIEEKLMSDDLDCIQAGKHLEHQNLFVSAIDPIDQNDGEWARLISLSKRLNTSKKVPNSRFSGCRSLYPFPEDSKIYQRFQSSFERIDQSILEYSSPENILTILNIVEFSTPDSLLDFLTKLFDENLDHEWTAYTLASYYFRSIAQPGKAVECLKIALHLAPFKYFGVPLLSLANVLHQSGRSSDAQAILESSLPFEPMGLSGIYFLLGQIYAVTLQHESSIWALEKCLNLAPDYQLAKLHLSVVKCHTKLEKALEMQHENLQITLDQLDTYKKRMDKIQKLQADVVANIVDPSSKIRSDLLYDEIVFGPLEGVSCKNAGPKQRKRFECDIIDYRAYKKHKNEILDEIRSEERKRKRETENNAELDPELDDYDDDAIFFTKARE